MSDDLHALDRDGALAEATAGAAPATRRALLRTLAAAGLVGSPRSSPPRAAPRRRASRRATSRS